VSTIEEPTSTIDDPATRSTDSTDSTSEPADAAAPLAPDDPAARRPTPWWRGPRWYQGGIVAVALLALAVRLLNVLVWRPACQEDLIALIEERGSQNFTPTGGRSECFGTWGDSAYYYIQGRQIARGTGSSTATAGSPNAAVQAQLGQPAAVLDVPRRAREVGLTTVTDMRVHRGGRRDRGGAAGHLTRKLAGRGGDRRRVVAAVFPML
jgi:hypothetical protein